MNGTQKWMIYGYPHFIATFAAVDVAFSQQQRQVHERLSHRSAEGQQVPTCVGVCVQRQPGTPRAVFRLGAVASGFFCSKANQ